MKKRCLAGTCLLLSAAVWLAGCAAAPTPAPVPEPSGAAGAAETTTSAAATEFTTTTTTSAAAVTKTEQTAVPSTGRTTAGATAATQTQATASATTTTTTTTTVATRAEVTVTIPEGYSFMQIARLLEKKGVCTAADFYAVCQSYTPQSFTIPLTEERCFRMEGYLFPDTYRFYVNDRPESVLIRMLNNFRSKVGEISDDTLILASIIEREARSDTHMRLVSSVFHNRLNNRKEFLYLNADPTRDYVNTYITGNPLVKEPAQYAPLYNTCGKRIGLPAGPICSPGLRAIRAAKEPADSPYYYFFYGKDADNHYSVTLEEHEQKMAEIGVG